MPADEGTAHNQTEKHRQEQSVRQRARRNSGKNLPGNRVDGGGTHYQKGEYGGNDVFIGVPSIIGRNGVKEVLELSKYFVGVARNHFRTGLNKNMQFSMYVYEGIRSLGVVCEEKSDTPSGNSVRIARDEELSSDASSNVTFTPSLKFNLIARSSGCSTDSS